MSSSRLLARNTAWNLGGQIIPMIVAFVAIPLLIEALGAQRFGVLTLAQAAIGYFSMFDLGLGRALTQAVADRLGAGHGAEEIAEVAWTAIVLMLALSLVGAIVLAGATPLLVGRVLDVPAPLAVETRTAFYLLAVSLPCVVLTAGLRGLLEAHQHFGTANALRVPLAIFTFLGPLAVLPFSRNLGAVVATLVVGRYATLAAHAIVCARRYPELWRHGRASLGAVAPLVRSGGWMTVSNVVSPVMVYLDRFLIGAMLPLSAVAYYVTPYEAVTRLLVIPQAMLAAFFPAFAITFARDRTRTAHLFEGSLRATALIMFPVLFVVAVFAREGLSAWVGGDIAARSAPVLQWLVIGVFLNALAQAPFAVLQGTGRSHVTAFLHLVELPIYVGMLWWFALRYGIQGVAMAWTFRVGIDAVALILLARGQFDPAMRQDQRALLSAAAFATILASASIVQGPFGTKLLVTGMVAVVFSLVAWRALLRADERLALANPLQRLRRRASA